MSSERQRLEDECLALMVRIDECLVQIGRGQPPALGDMEMRAARLCSDIKASGAPTAHALQPAMVQMISKLDELARALEGS